MRLARLGTGRLYELQRAALGVTRLRRGDRLVLASHNPGKLREIAALLAPFGVAVLSAGSLGLPEPEETEPDFAGNARLKAVAAADGERVAGAGRRFGVLRGGAGRRAGRAVGALGRAGQGFRGRDGAGQRAGRRPEPCLVRLRAVPGLARRETATFLGRVDGQTCWPPRGGTGFGYDPMFVPAGGTLSYGEIDPRPSTPAVTAHGRSRASSRRA